MRQPAWAERIWCDGAGLYAAHADGACFQLPAATPDRPVSEWECVGQAWAWADRAGVDKFGLWADLMVQAVRYRLRWIPPGRFLMGSPEDEAGRFEDEVQHPVQLTQGFWLGETSVTQALWEAVMGENPGSPKQGSLPVNQVNWDDCGKLIERLQGLVPALSLALPTEAQWEYACRAGTRTAYWWGDEFDPEYANDGDEIKKEDSMLGNPFGLKSMSGNLDEWCADWSGSYSTEEVSDPTGPQQGRDRVLRGGGWLDVRRNLRSAYRSASPPGYRYRNIGLRLAGGSDPQASGRPLTADGRPWSGRQGGGQGTAAGTGKAGDER